MFLDDFQHHWPTDHDHMYVDFVRNGLRGNGGARTGDSRWRRLTELRSRTAKSVFHFDGQGSVAKSSHAGIPWLRFLRRELGSRVHFWPFDGWTPPAGVSVIAEVYPALWSRSFPPNDRNPHQHDAYSIAKWMQHADAAGWLGGFFTPKLTSAEQTLARVEGWILGFALALQRSTPGQRRMVACTPPECHAGSARSFIKFDSSASLLLPVNQRRHLTHNLTHP